MYQRNKRVRWEPHEYQKRGVEWLVTHRYAALLWEPGLGKTTTTLKALQVLRDAGRIDKALIVAPLRVVHNVWSASKGGELDKWVDFRCLRAVALHGPKKSKLIDEDADIYTINPEGLVWLVESGGLDVLIKRGVNCLVFDELSKFKHSTTRRFKTIKKHLGKFTYRYGLTGSPASNGLEDLFGQAYVIDGGESLGKYITHYRARYFNAVQGYKRGGTFRTYALRAGAEDEIYAAASSWALAMRAIDHLDLPTLNEQDIYIDLPSKARAVYDDLERDFIAELNGDIVTVANAAVLGGKCRQVASGGLYTNEAGEARKTAIVHSEKAQALADLVDELQGQPLLVGYQFDHDLQQIRATLGDVPALNGSTKGRDADQLLVDWNAGKIPVLCGHPASMGHGLNMQSSGSRVCWYSIPWDFEHYDQANRRVWRQGQQAGRVTIYRILARDTVDERVARVIRMKRDRQDGLMVALRDLRKDRANAR